MLDFRILGRLEITRDGQPIELAGQRQLTALAVLVLHANRLVPSERLVDAVWGERPPPTAPTALRNTISQLRKLLGEDAIETRPPGYALRVDEQSIDIVRVERAIAAATDATPHDRLRLLREALAEWRGELLPELAYVPFLQDEIRRLDELRLLVQEDVIDAELAHDPSPHLVQTIESLVARHPHRERLRAQLMLALYRTGRQADALEAYRDARRVLADDLGLEPGPALRRLHGSILRQEAGLETNAARDDATSADHLRDVVAALAGGRLVPVIASAPDVAEDLALRVGYPAGEVLETARVSQFVAALRGYGPLHDELHTLAEGHGEPGPVERFFASLPPILRARGLPHQLLVTTDYHGALERAFADAREEVDVVAYLAAGPSRGKFCHVSPDGSARVIEDPGGYATELSLERRTVIVCLRGRADPAPGRDWESFVVTEDDHIDYLRRADVAGALPVGLAATLRRSHFLFLGYGVRDWCLRLVLGRICTETPLAYRSWAVSAEPRATEHELWRAFGVDLVAAPIAPYLRGLAQTLDAELEVAV